MANHTIFLLHGMGKYGTVGADGIYKPDTDGWFKQAEAALKGAYDDHIKAGIGGGAKFEDQFEVVGINYDSWFEIYRFAWAKQAKEWTKIQEGWAGLGLPGDWLDKIGKFLSGADKDDFGWTHALDVVLYVHRLIRDAAVSGVISDIANKLEKTPTTWSMIGHSLGTSVMHDTFAGVAARVGQKSVMPPRLVCSVANVARALTNSDVDAYGDFLAPGAEGFRPRAYLNFNHALDFIAQIDPFDPRSGAWASNHSYYNYSKLSQYYIDPGALDWKGVSVTDAIKTLLPHGFGHYMMQPEVTAILWPKLLNLSPGHTFQKISSEVAEANRQKRDKDVQEALQKHVEGLLKGLSPDQEKVASVVIKAIIAFVGGQI